MWLITPIPCSRRLFLKKTGQFAAGALLAGVSTKAPAIEHAEYFAAGGFAASYARLFNGQTVIDSDSLAMTLPETAEDGAVVPITISSDLDNIERLYLFADKNPTPLIAEFELTPWVTTYLTARIKLAESCNVILIARRGDQLLRCSRWVKVVHGGCGVG